MSPPLLCSARQSRGRPTYACTFRYKDKVRCPTPPFPTRAICRIMTRVVSQAFHPSAALPPQPPAVMPVTGRHRKFSVGGIHYVGVLWVGAPNRHPLCAYCVVHLLPCLCTETLFQVSVLSCHNLVNKDTLSKRFPVSIFHLLPQTPVRLSI